MRIGATHAWLQRKALRVRRRVRMAVQLRGHSYDRSLLVHHTVRFEGEDIRIGKSVRIGHGGRLRGPCVIERGCFINDGVWVTPQTYIQRNCSIGPFVRFVTDSHHVGPPSRRAGATVFKPITVGAGTWIGAGAIILPGVTIGEGVVIGAGSVVTRDVTANTLVMGSPARFVRDLHLDQPES